MLAHRGERRWDGGSMARYSRSRRHTPTAVGLEVARLRNELRLTQAELAEATKTPLGTMKSQLKRAQTLLKRELGEVAPGGDYDPSAIDLERWGPDDDSADEDEQ